MTQQYRWEKVEAPRGAFISWGNRAGQKIIGRVVTYDPVGGTIGRGPRQGERVPQTVYELLEDGWSVNEQNVATKYGPGELVILNCTQVQLRNLMLAADPHPGDIHKIILEGFTSTPNGTAKDFDFSVVRGTRPPQQPQGGQQPAQQPRVNQAAPPPAQAQPAASQGADPWGQQPQPAQAAPWAQQGDFGGQPLSDEPPF